MHPDVTLKQPAALAWTGFLTLVSAGALQLGPRAAHAETWSGDAMVQETSVCTLGRVNRARADTRTCLGCHDGTSAAGVAYQRPSDLGRTCQSALYAAHPLDVDYQLAWAKKPALLRPAVALPENLLLPLGRLSCVTCHDGTSRERNHVSVSMRRSQLCTSCHAM